MKRPFQFSIAAIALTTVATAILMGIAKSGGPFATVARVLLVLLAVEFAGLVFLPLFFLEQEDEE